MAKIRVASFFSGGGGLDIGFEQTGYDVVFATDIDKHCCATLEANRGTYLSAKAVVLQEDIRTLADRPDLLPQAIDLVIGGPPCQTFSASGRRAGGAAGTLDRRGTLFEAYCRVVDRLRPQAFVFENVRGILSTHGGRDWQDIVAAFLGIGYRLSYRILDALDYGAPQQRERMVLVGHRLAGDFLFPRPLFGPDSPDEQAHRTARQALQDIEEDEDLAGLSMRDGKYAHLLPLVPPGENYLHFTAKRGYPSPVFAYRSRFSDFLYKAHPDAPVKTIIARPGKYTGPFHWDSRSFSVKEYARLQGFPDGYRFVGGRDQAIRQIGNSVSPCLSRQLALAVGRQLFGKRVAVPLLPTDTPLSFDRRKKQKASSTRALHQVLETANVARCAFRLHDYATQGPADAYWSVPRRVSAQCRGRQVAIDVDTGTRRLFATMVIEIDAPGADGPVTLEVTARGTSPQTVLAMWHAVDDWVIRSSTYHSLFELYGHFTEPHPIFRVVAFKGHAKLPILRFAEYCADFAHCSRQLPRKHLTDLFGVAATAANFVDLAKWLRGFRYDIRCRETNLTMPADSYLIAYPFALPFGKQMNFSVADQRPAAADIALAA